MADFAADFQSFRPPNAFLDMDPNMEFVNHFAELSQTVLQDGPVSTLNFQNNFSHGQDSFFCNQVGPDFPGNLIDGFPGGAGFHPGGFVPQDVSGVESVFQDESRKRKAIDVSESSSGISSAVASDSGKKRKHGSGRAKRIKNNEKEEEKPKEVVHVRARRGQATDSHSLAERVRRGKINERLKCLQDIVPGCYKTMGLAVMLDEIINYVQSLQNQVEFLSMKLTAASSYYDFNSESDAVDKMQRAMAGEAKEIERRMRKGHGENSNGSHPTWHP